MKFKLNDRVRYVSNKHGDNHCNPLWNGLSGKVVGTIDELYSNDDSNKDLVYGVQWGDKHHHNSYRRTDLQLHQILPEELFAL